MAVSDVLLGDTGVPLERVINTADLGRRPSRAPDYGLESRALNRLMAVMAADAGADTLLQTLAETALDVCSAHSAGISILEKRNDGDVFRWRAAAGQWSVHRGETMPRESPCGAVLDCNSALLMRHPERHYAYAENITLAIAEALLIPFHVGGAPVGTIWVVAHDETRRFDAEDLRLMESLGRFAAGAYRLLDHERVERELAATQRLQEVSTKLIRERKIEGLYGDLLETAAAIMGSDCASMQMYRPDRGAGELQLLAHRGFTQQAARSWAWVAPTSTTSCGVALATAQRVIVPDTKTDGSISEEEQHHYNEAGIRSMQSTPLVSRGGHVLGMISTHWRRPHQPSQQALNLLDILARQVADLLEREQAERKLTASEARLAAVLDQMPCGVGLMDLQGKWMIANATMRRFVPKQKPSGDPEQAHRWRVFDAHGSPLASTQWPGARALRGEPVHSGAELVYTTEDGEDVWTRVAAVPFRDPNDEVAGAIATIEDVTEQKRAAERERMLMRELQHRGSNLLAVIQSIAQQSLSDADTLAQARAKLEARLQAVARAYRRITAADWASIGLADIVRSELEPFASRIAIDGPEMTLTTQQAQNLALAMHELATNAAKHGALSNRSGTVSVSWRPGGGPAGIHFRWMERGGPAVTPPAHPGFGTRLLKALSSEARFDYPPEGFSCEIDLR